MEGAKDGCLPLLCLLLDLDHDHVVIMPAVTFTLNSATGLGSLSHSEIPHFQNHFNYRSSILWPAASLTLCETRESQESPSHDFFGSARSVLILVRRLGVGSSTYP